VFPYVFWIEALRLSYDPLAQDSDVEDTREEIG
jgi:hypothetical protein